MLGGMALVSEEIGKASKRTDKYLSIPSNDMCISVTVWEIVCHIQCKMDILLRPLLV